MQDDKIKELFDNFRPELSSDRLFMQKMHDKLEAVEIVKKYSTEQKRLDRKACLIAALIGFVIGAACTMTLPYIGKLVSDLSNGIPGNAFIRILYGNYQIIAWLAIIVTSGLITLNSYEIIASLMNKRIRKATADAHEI